MMRMFKGGYREGSPRFPHLWSWIAWIAPVILLLLVVGAHIVSGDTDILLVGFYGWRTGHIILIIGSFIAFVAGIMRTIYTVQICMAFKWLSFCSAIGLFGQSFSMLWLIHAGFTIPVIWQFLIMATVYVSFSGLISDASWLDGTYRRAWIARLNEKCREDV